MPQTYFADAWFFIGLLDRYDSSHRQIAQLMKRIGGARLVTHEAIFFEVLAFFSEEGSYIRAKAVEKVRETIMDGDVITPDRSLFLAALDRYAARPDKEYSLTDCLSMVVMERLGISHVLTNDHHFRQEGFTVISE